MSEDQLPDEYADEPQLLPHAPDVELVETSRAVIVSHIPGQPLETRADAEAREAFEAEDRADVKVNAHVAEYAGEVDVTSAEANLATRSNIVPGGAGTVGG